jgi:hypothetical protein
VAEPARSEREVGWREVVLVGAAVAAVGLGLALLSVLVPAFGELFNRLPIAIAVLIVGTVWVLWRITRRDGRG